MGEIDRRSALLDIYSPLRDRAGRNCCDDGDCRPAPYRVMPTGVQMGTVKLSEKDTRTLV